MQVVAILPARIGSTRFPGKPLARQTGKYLIQHVYEQVSAARRIDRCIVATDDERIAEAVRSFDGEAAMTSPDHRTGTDRIAEVVRGMDGAADDIILNIQGDEPEIDPAPLDRLVESLAADDTCRMGTLACPFPPAADPRDPNCVKVVRDRRGRALFFSRAMIPWPRESEATAPWLLHLGVYAYRRDFLLDFAGWKPGVLEQVEKLEQLRVLENGFSMTVTVVDHGAPGIDTPEDYRRFVARHNARTKS